MTLLIVPTLISRRIWLQALSREHGLTSEIRVHCSEIRPLFASICFLQSWMFDKTWKRCWPYWRGGADRPLPQQTQNPGHSRGLWNKWKECYPTQHVEVIGNKRGHSLLLIMKMVQISSALSPQDCPAVIIIQHVCHQLCFPDHCHGIFKVFLI